MSMLLCAMTLLSHHDAWNSSRNSVGINMLSVCVDAQYSASVATVVTDTTLIPVNDTWHPEITDVVYWGMVCCCSVT